MTDSDSAWDRWKLDPAVMAAAEKWQATNSTECTPDETLYRLFHDDPEKAFAIVLALIQMIQDDKTFYSFAAGPLEDFLSINGEAFIERIHALALQHRRIRVALGGVWQGTMKKPVWRRIEALGERPSQFGRSA